MSDYPEQNGRNKRARAEVARDKVFARRKLRAEAAQAMRRAVTDSLRAPSAREPLAPPASASEAGS